MANLGSAISNNFQIGQAELRIGTLERAGKLTQADSVGLLKTATVNIAKTYAELKAGETNSRIHSSLTGYDLEVNAEMYEFTRRNLAMSMKADSASSFSSSADGMKDVSATLGTAVTAGVLPTDQVYVTTVDSALCTAVKESKGRWVSVSNSAGLLGFAAALAPVTTETTTGGVPTKLSVDAAKAQFAAVDIAVKNVGTLKNAQGNVYFDSLKAIQKRISDASDLIKSSVEYTSAMSAIAADFNLLPTALPTTAVTGVPNQIVSVASNANNGYAPGTAPVYSVVYSKEIHTTDKSAVKNKTMTQVAFDAKYKGSTFINSLASGDSSIASLNAKISNTKAAGTHVGFSATKSQLVSADLEGHLIYGTYGTPDTISAMTVTDVAKVNAVATALSDVLSASSAARTVSYSAKSDRPIGSVDNSLVLQFFTTPKVSAALDSTVAVEILHNNLTSTGLSTVAGYTETNSGTKAIKVPDLIGANFTWEKVGTLPTFKDTFGIYEKDRLDTVKLVKITTADPTTEGIEFKFEASGFPTEAVVGNHFVYRANQVALTAGSGCEYATVDILSKDPTTKAVRGFRFWKVGIQGNIDFTFSPDAYASVPLKLVVFEPTQADVDAGGALYDVRDDVEQNKFGMFWGG